MEKQEPTACFHTGIKHTAHFAASPFRPGKAIPASAMASTMAVTTLVSIGVSVAANISGDWETTPKRLGSRFRRFSRGEREQIPAYPSADRPEGCP